MLVACLLSVLRWRQPGKFPHTVVALHRKRLLGSTSRCPLTTSTPASSCLLLMDACLICAVHGTAPTVNRILDHPDIRAVAFVGSNGAGQHVLKRGTSHGKRIQVWKPTYDSSFFWAYVSRGQREAAAAAGCASRLRRGRHVQRHPADGNLECFVDRQRAHIDFAAWHSTRHTTMAAENHAVSPDAAYYLNHQMALSQTDSAMPNQRWSHHDPSTSNENDIDES